MSHAVAYGYDAGGNLTAVQAPSGVTAGYAYSGRSSEEVHRHRGRRAAGGPQAEFPPTGLNTVISTRTYNLRGQVATLQVTSPAGTVLDQSFDYAFTAGGAGARAPSTRARTSTASSTAATRARAGELDRLWKATTLAGAPLYTYLYDANGNRTEET